MKKILKFCLGLVLFSAIIALGIFVVWAIASVLVVKYLFKLRGKYENPKDCLKEGKNIIAIVAGIILLIVVPINFIKTSKEYDKEQKIKQEQQAILEQEEKIEYEIKKKEKEIKKERAKVLNAKARVEKEIKSEKDYNKVIALTKEEIEKHNITEEEIEKFNEDVENAIIKLKDDKMAAPYEKAARKYVSGNTSYVSPKLGSSNYSFNEDKSVCTITGTYRSKNSYGLDVRGRYSIEFDTSSGEMINEFIGDEKITNQNINKQSKNVN
ncbi:hypothetical protein [[Clostridium] dakarense]|uniref:hypothetical protein n=1 Tax=Faecalimicrobium dakarense TaxID=1301100 RepID=UPI0004BBD788|nr:hypothetical protein [[Clostridium] dakarense]